MTYRDMKSTWIISLKFTVWPILFSEKVFKKHSCNGCKLRIVDFESNNRVVVTDVNIVLNGPYEASRAKYFVDVLGAEGQDWMGGGAFEK